MNTHCPAPLNGCVIYYIQWICIIQYHSFKYCYFYTVQSTTNIMTTQTVEMTTTGTSSQTYAYYIYNGIAVVAMNLCMLLTVHWAWMLGEHYSSIRMLTEIRSNTYSLNLYYKFWNIFAKYYRGHWYATMKQCPMQYQG